MSISSFTVAYTVECLVGEPSGSVSLDLFIWMVTFPREVVFGLVLSPISSILEEQWR